MTHRLSQQQLSNRRPQQPKHQPPQPSRHRPPNHNRHSSRMPQQSRHTHTRPPSLSRKDTAVGRRRPEGGASRPASCTTGARSLGANAPAIGDPWCGHGGPETGDVETAETLPWTPPPAGSTEGDAESVDGHRRRRCHVELRSYCSDQD